MHSSFLWLLTNIFDVYPLSILIPLVTLVYVSDVCESSMVTIPSLPTCSYVLAIILPSSESLFADIDATFFNVLPLTFLDLFSNLPTITSVMSFMCLITSVTLCLSFNSSCPCNTIASVNTTLVVVPSPALVAVLSAASFIILTARFSTGSSRKIDFATVTPSLVTVIPCVWFGLSISTVLPRGPSVLFTALEIVVIPFINLSLPSLSKTKSFGFIMFIFN